MTLNDLESENSEFSMNCIARRTSKEQFFAEITSDRPSQPAWKIKLMVSRVS